MKKVGLFILSFFTFAVSAQDFKPQPGDLFFQDLDCGPFCEAIEKVTQGFNNYNLSHVGIVINYNNALHIIEAGSNGVVYTPIATFLERSKNQNNQPKVIVGRLSPQAKMQLQVDVNKALQCAQQKIGLPYDDGFDISNNAYYCSELVYDCFKDHLGRNIFKLSPMTFKNPETGKTFEAWNNYFDELSLNIPEGLPGLNPGGISLSNHIQIVYEYGAPSQKEQ